MNIVRLNTTAPDNVIVMGGNTGGGGGDNYEYIDVRGLDEDATQILLDNSFYIKAGGDYPFIGVTAGQLGTDVWPYVIAVGIDFSAFGYKEEGYEVTIKETFIDNGFTEEQIASFPRITKEEFFTL